MYYFYLDKVQIPIPPPSMTTTIHGKNEVVNLLGAGEVNIVKPAGLTDWSFKVLLPNNDYPFNQSLLMKSKQANYYLDTFERFMMEKKPIRFIVVRMSQRGDMLSMTNTKVTLEDYTIEESHALGIDCEVSLKLKQWKDWGSKKLKVETDEKGNPTGTVSKDRSSDKVPNKSAKVSKKMTLQQLIKRELGNTNNLFAIAALNKIAVPGVLAVGQAILLKKESGL